MSHFNLIDEKWIPVRLPDGSREELGIRDTLLRANEIAVIEDPSPLVVAALHRFLLAVLYRALEGPTDIKQAKTLFREGLPSQKISDYLEKWKDRFCLFDEQYPFYQVAAYEPQEKKGKKNWKTWPAIAAEHNASNAKVLFDHVDISTAGPIPSSIAARWLVACQTFALGGGNSDFVYTKSALSATAAMTLPLGRSLHDTLVFSLVPENREVLAADWPVWEQGGIPISKLKSGVSRPVTGTVDLYTWVARSIKFRLDGNGQTLSELAFASGIDCSLEGYIDPMVSYRIDDKKGKVSIALKNRGLWRDFDSLLPDKSHMAPQVIEHAMRLTRSQQHRFPKSVIVLGQANSKAKIEFWRMECFTLPKARIEDRFVRSEIKQLLTIAELAARAMEKSLQNEARLNIAKGGRKLQKDKWKAGKWVPGDVSKFIGKTAFEMEPAALAGYWSNLEANFHKILSEFDKESDPDDIRYQWLRFVCEALIAAWDQHRSSVVIGDAWAMRALVKAEKFVLHKFKELNEEINKFEPQEAKV